MPKSQKILRLILGDQLNHKHRWFRSADPSAVYVLMEVRQETDYVDHHIQKVVAMFGAMRAFAAWLKKRGHAVIYLRLDEKGNSQSFEKNLRTLIKRHGITRFEYLLPDEYRLDQELKRLSDSLPVESAAVDTEHFLTERDDVRNHFEGKKTFLMESFYRAMRKKHDILMTGGEPEGGRWNFDQENRNRYDSAVPLPTPRTFENDLSDIHRMVAHAGVRTIGKIDPGKVIWPITREQALTILRVFIKDLLPYFGRYQDAMTTESWSLFHSRISFALNIKLLSPVEVIEKAIDAYRKRGDEISLAQVEGFARQILGWREYMRGIYWAHMPEFADKNYFEHTTDLPSWYWDGKTDLHCLQHAIGQSLEFAYAHHIQRLMITGNFALLAGIDPDEVDRWYLGIYIDAIEWVEITNTRGMSQFADGGITATKPYVSSANYVHKMSDYCKSCRYDRSKKYGDRACPFNSLYWHFLDRHEKKLSRNPRMGNMYRVWQRMKQSEREKILTQAELYLKQLDSL